MTLEFVDNNNAVIDSATRRRIRRSAAMGKNAGKTLVRPSRKEARGLGFKLTTTLVRNPEKIRQDSCDSENSKGLGIERQVGNTISVCSFPEQRTPEATGLVERGM